MATKYPVQSDVEIKISSIGGDLKIEGSSEAEIRARGDDPQVEVVEDGHSAEIMCNGDCVLSVPDGAQITVDLEAQTVTGPDGATYRFDLDANHKERLLKGLDDIGLVMQNIAEIEAFETKHHSELPWLA